MFNCAGYNGGRHRYYRMRKGTWDNGKLDGYFEVYCSNGYAEGYEVTYSGNVMNNYWNGDVTMSWVQVSDGSSDSGVIHAINGEFPVIRQEGEKYVYVVF